MEEKEISYRKAKIIEYDLGCKGHMGIVFQSENECFSYGSILGKKMEFIGKSFDEIKEKVIESLRNGRTEDLDKSIEKGNMILSIKEGELESIARVVRESKDEKIN